MLLVREGCSQQPITKTRCSFNNMHSLPRIARNWKVGRKQDWSMQRLSHDGKTQAFSIFLFHQLPQMDFLIHHTPRPNTRIAVSLCSSLEEKNLSQKPQANFSSGPIGQDWVTWPRPTQPFWVSLAGRLLLLTRKQQKVDRWGATVNLSLYLLVNELSKLRWKVTGRKKFWKLCGREKGKLGIMDTMPSFKKISQFFQAWKL